MNKLFTLIISLLLINSLQAQNVGINVPNPKIKLDVSPAATIGTSATITSQHDAANRGRKVSFGAVVDSDTSEFTGMRVAVNPGTSGCGNSGDILFNTWECNTAGSREVMRINGLGFVGIGTTSPISKLTIGTDVYDPGWVHTNGSIQLGSLLGGAGSGIPDGGFIGTFSNHPLYLFTNDYNLPQLTLTTNGNVGIGTNAPDYRLTLRGSGNEIYSVMSEDGTQATDNFTFQIAPGGGSSTSRIGYLMGNFGEASNGFMISNMRNAPIRFGFGGGPTEVMRIAPSGDVGIGTNNPGAKLEVAGQIKITGGTPGTNKVLTSDANGLASWQTAAGSHFVGESFGGGIVFYVYDNGQHGLIAATADQSTGVQWYNGAGIVTNATRAGINGGFGNTERIIITQGAGTYAASVCSAYNGGGFADWYLPHLNELNEMYNQRAVIGGFAAAIYWNSGEISATNASAKDFSTGISGSGAKATLYRVRAIRAF